MPAAPQNSSIRCGDGSSRMDLLPACPHHEGFGVEWAFEFGRGTELGEMQSSLVQRLVPPMRLPGVSALLGGGTPMVVLYKTVPRDWKRKEPIEEVERASESECGLSGEAERGRFSGVAGFSCIRVGSCETDADA